MSNEQLVDYLEQAQTAITQERVADAQTILNEAIVAYPDNTRFKVALASVALAQGDYQAAQLQLNRAVALAPEELALYNQLGVIYFMAGQSVLAEEAFCQTLALDPTNLDALTNLAELAYARGDHEQAARHYLTALDHHPQEVDLWLAAGQLALELNDKETARATFQQALALDPAQDDVRQAVIALEQQIESEAVRLSNEPTLPEEAAHLLQQAQSAIHQRDWATAEDALRRCIERSPTFLDAYVTLSDLLTEQGNHEAAAELLAQIREIAPDAPPLIKRIGRNCYARGDFSQAERLFRQMLLQTPKDPEVTTTLGQICIDLERYPEAYDYLRNAVQLDPRALQAWAGLAALAQRQGDEAIFTAPYDQARQRDQTLDHYQLLIDVIGVMTEGADKHWLRGLGFRLFGHLPQTALVNAGDTVVHAGCWRAETMEGWAQAVGPTGQVVIIEADNLNHDVLKIEVARRKLDNVILVHKAVWNRPGQVTLQVSDLADRNKLREAQTFSPRQPDENYREEKTVEADTIDHMVQLAGVKPINHLHMEISGAEIEGIEGMAHTLQTPGIRLFIRSLLLHESDGKPVNTRVVQLLRDHGLDAHCGRPEPDRNMGSNIYAARI